MLIGRTDARAVVGLDDAIERGKAYRDAGADIVFVEAPQSLEELQTIARAIPDAPLFANMIEGGVTPVLTATELEELGFKMVVFPLSPLYAAAAAVQEVAKRLKTTGTTAGSTLLPFGRLQRDRGRAGLARARAGIRGLTVPVEGQGSAP